MKQIYLATLLALALPTHAIADNSLTAALQESANAAVSAYGSDMAIKVNLSGKQRMLTQKMSKESLLVGQDIDKENNLKNLKGTMELFEKTLTGLQKGNEELKLEPTYNKKILDQLGEVEKLWIDFKPNVQAVIDGKSDKATMEKIASNNLPLLKAMNVAVKMYEENSGANESALAATINLSGRQRMLTQKMTKELLLIANEIDADENRKNLESTINLFDTTLTGLEKGDSKAGLSETTDEGILKQLEVVKTKWDAFRPIVEKADTSSDNLKKAAELNLPLLQEMNKAVKMYEAQSAS